jgi:peptide chain release factor 3
MTTHPEIRRQTARRRTFAIISHPDAGKTTITEKLLLYGGAKDLAGGVRDRKNATATSSDWLELEKQRGISVSSTVLQFAYGDYRINLLDTPGHRDFSEDTYRVLTAVDSALMVLDVAKGIEEQTLKLFEVCRSRGIPIITFINKCDRPGKEPLELLDEIEARLGLKTFAVNLPIGDGPDFKGIFDRVGNRLHLFERVPGGRFRAPVTTSGPDDPALREAVPARALAHLAETHELLEAAGGELDHAAVAAGELTPVFFGSAVNNFGVQLLLDGFLEYASPPRPRGAQGGEVAPDHPAFSAFVFKIQANMDPNHRDRLVFLRVCSGRFHRDLPIRHAQSGKELRLNFTHQVFGRERESMDEAWPGDILGITGKSGLEIGDTLSEQPGVVFHPIPRFAPEAFIRLRHSQTKDFKRFRKGLDQLLQEKVVQQFYALDTESRVPLLGAVGPLQFDVVCYRLLSEYGVEAQPEPAPWTVTRWVDPSVEEAELIGKTLYGSTLVRDAAGLLCLLFESDWNREYFLRQNPDIQLHSMPPVNGVEAH